MGSKPGRRTEKAVNLFAMARNRTTPFACFSMRAGFEAVTGWTQISPSKQLVSAGGRGGESPGPGLVRQHNVSFKSE